MLKMRKTFYVTTILKLTGRKGPFICCKITRNLKTSFHFGYTIIKFPAYFNRAISWKKWDQVLNNQKIDKLGQGQSTKYLDPIT